MIKFFCASNDKDQLVRNIIYNPKVNKHEIEIQLDNNRDKGLPKRYNEFIERNLDSNCWLVFIHDDVELLEDIEVKLEGVPRNMIYGLCGAKKVSGKGAIIGQILCQDPRIHNGNKFVFGRAVHGYEVVPTFDPLCIIMHSSLSGLPRAKDRLRFDENLGYHLFSEELSIRANGYGIKSAVLEIDCCHYSWGCKTPEYYEALEYIKQKHGLEHFICTPEHECMDDSAMEDWE